MSKLSKLSKWSKLSKLQWQRIFCSIRPSAGLIINALTQLLSVSSKWRFVLAASSFLLASFNVSAQGLDHHLQVKPSPKLWVHNVATTAPGRVITLQESKSTSNLYYNTSLNPISTHTVLSPVDGTVVQIFFNYGSAIKRGQHLFSLSSDKLADDYRSAIQDYLQKKQAAEKSQRDAATDEALYRAGAESRDQYQSSKTNYETATLSLMQSKEKLHKVLLIAGVDPRQVEQLTLDDTSKVNAILQRKFDHFTIKSPASGVALFPDKSLAAAGGDDSGAGQKLVVGSAVKQGQLLLAVGDLTGLSAKLQVSEVNINRVRVGQAVLLSGDAFPGLQLAGKVVAVSSQAGDSDNYGQGGLSMFDVVVNIPKVTPAQAQKIRVGMTARVRMSIVNQAVISVPIAAVQSVAGKHYVSVVLSNGQHKRVLVVTGETTPAGQVSILQGLRGGQQIWVPATLGVPQ